MCRYNYFNSIKLLFDDSFCDFEFLVKFHLPYFHLNKVSYQIGKYVFPFVKIIVSVSKRGFVFRINALPSTYWCFPIQKSPLETQIFKRVSLAKSFSLIDQIITVLVKNSNLGDDKLYCFLVFFNSQSSRLPQVLPLGWLG